MSACVEIRSYSDLLEALLARKNSIGGSGISNELLEEIAGIARGHVDKVFGPSREKRMGWSLFDLLLPALAVKLVLVVDEAQARLMQSRYERRNTKQIRVRSQDVNRTLLEHAKLEVFSEMGRRGGLMRAATHSPAQLTQIMSEVARARWRKRRRKRDGRSAISNSSREVCAPNAARRRKD